MIDPVPVGSCVDSIPGFQCFGISGHGDTMHPLPALAGEMVRCFPLAKFTNYSEVYHKTVPPPICESDLRPDGIDPRYLLFPKDYPTALGRCCSGKISSLFDMHPLPCNSDDPIRYWTRESEHILSSDQLLHPSEALKNKLSQLNTKLALANIYRQKLIDQKLANDVNDARVMNENWLFKRENILYHPKLLNRTFIDYINKSDGTKSHMVASLKL